MQLRNNFCFISRRKHHETMNSLRGNDCNCNPQLSRQLWLTDDHQLDVMQRKYYEKQQQMTCGCLTLSLICHQTHRSHQSHSFSRNLWPWTRLVSKFVTLDKQISGKDNQLHIIALVLVGGHCTNMMKIAKQKFRHILSALG